MESSLNVTVRDSRGHIVRGLEAPDFSVSQDGAAAQVSGAHFIEAGKDPIHVTLLFDRMRGEPSRISRAAAMDLLAAGGANVEFSVWLVDQQLMALQPPSGDRKAVKLAVEAATGKNSPAASTPVSEAVEAALRGSAQLLRESRYRPSIAALISLSRAQQGVAGRKAVVYFSEGLPLPNGDESLLSAISAANRAGVGVYVVDASGLAISKEEERRARSPSTTAWPPAARPSTRKTNRESTVTGGPGDRGLAVGNLENKAIFQTSAIEQLAEKTGAFAISHGGDFRGPIRRLLDELNAYYVVTYASPGDTPDGRFHEVRATVRRDKTKVQASAGFFAGVEGPGGVPLAF